LGYIYGKAYICFVKVVNQNQNLIKMATQKLTYRQQIQQDKDVLLTMSYTDLLAYELKKGMYMNRKSFIDALKSIGIDFLALKNSPKKTVNLNTTTGLDSFTKMQLLAVIERDTKLNPSENKTLFLDLLKKMEEVYRNNYETFNLICQQQFVQKVSIASDYSIIF
jgi:hypothetical protein